MPAAGGEMGCSDAYPAGRAGLMTTVLRECQTPVRESTAALHSARESSIFSSRSRKVSAGRGNSGESAESLCQLMAGMRAALPGSLEPSPRTMGQPRASVLRRRVRALALRWLRTAAVKLADRKIILFSQQKEPVWGFVSRFPPGLALGSAWEKTAISPPITLAREFTGTRGLCGGCSPFPFVR